MVPQPQGTTLAKALGRARHQATTTWRTGVPAADRTHTITDTASRAPPGQRDPETRREARTTGDTGALPTPLTSPKWGNSTEVAGARTQEAAEGDSSEGPDSRRAEQTPVVAVEEATVPAAHLAVHVLPALPDTDRHCPPLRPPGTGGWNR